MKSFLAAAFWAVTAAAALAECSENQVDLRGDWGSARFTVEIADDRDEVQLGLMHRESMPPNAGMLFIYPQAGPVGFWMRNTLIPLDMLFIGSDGIVRKVHENAKPLDETTIFGGKDIQYVLEINGGMAAMLGITAGTELRHPRLDPAKAAWNCE